MPRGGFRKSAGRPKSGRKVHSIRATDEEWKLIKAYAEEVKEYESTGLLKHSWIDTYHRYFLPKGVTSIKPIGNLSSYDETRLTAFVMRPKK